jgi:signal transduction histidine kinase
MAQSPPADAALKQAMREALAESLADQRDLLYDVFTEVLEDIGLAEAIRQAKESEFDDRDTVNRALQGE